MAITLGGLIQDPDSLSYETASYTGTTEMYLNTSTLKIKLTRVGNLTADGVTLKCFYSKLKEIWKTDATLIKFPFPMIPITDEQFEFANGWSLDYTYASATAITVGSCSGTSGTYVITTTNNFNTSAVHPGIYLSGTGVNVGTGGASGQEGCKVISVDSNTQITVDTAHTGTVSGSVIFWSENDYPFNLIRTGGWATKNTSSITVDEWVNVTTLGTLGAQGSLKTLTAFVTTNASPTVTCTSTTGVIAGSTIVGPKLLIDTTVLSVDSPTGLTLSRNATGNSTGGIATVRPKDAVYFQVGGATDLSEEFGLSGAVNQALHTYSLAGGGAITANTHSSTTVDTISNPDGVELLVGYPVTGSGIPVNTVIATIVSPTSFTISNAATSTLTGTSLSIGYDHRLAASVFKLFTREQGYTYGNSTKGAIGESLLTYKKYAFPVSNSQDLKITHTDVQIDANADGVADVTPYNKMNIRWFNTAQVRKIGGVDYNFKIIVDGDNTLAPGTSGSVTVEQIYEFVQWKLRSANIIDTGWTISCDTNTSTAVTTTTQSLSSTTVSGSLVVTSSALFGTVAVGDAVSGTGIPTGAWVTYKTSSSSVTISHAATTSATNTLVYGGFNNLIAGQLVSGSGVPIGCEIESVNSATSITLSAATTSTLTGTALTYQTNVVGNTTRDIFKFVGDTLYTLYDSADGGVYIDNFNTGDINRVVFADNTGVNRTYPYTAAGSIAFNTYLVTDGATSNAIYRMFFKQLDTSKAFGTTAGVLVNKADNTTSISGIVSGASISFDFDYDGNTQAAWVAATNYVVNDEYRYGTTWYKVNTGYTSAGTFGSTDTTNSSVISGPTVVAVSLGLDNAQYVKSEGTIARSTSNSISLVSALERNYSNPA